jgi:hypothetical protein
MIGAACLPQKTNPDHKEDHGMNIASATEFLINQFKCPVTITFWQEVTEFRFQQWAAFLSKNSNAKQIPMIQPLDGGNEKGQEKKSPSLSLVPSDPV